jgi:hypothetical protein
VRAPLSWQQEDQNWPKINNECLSLHWELLGYLHRLLCRGRRKKEALQHVGVPIRPRVRSWQTRRATSLTFHITALITSFNAQAKQPLAMHAVRRSLVEEQAKPIGIPLWAVELPWPCSNLEYEERMDAICRHATAEEGYSGRIRGSLSARSSGLQDPSTARERFCTSVSAMANPHRARAAT